MKRKALACKFCGNTEGLTNCRQVVEGPVQIPHRKLTTDHLIVTRGGKHLKPLTVRHWKAWRRMTRFDVTMYAVNYAQEKPAKSLLTSFFLFYRFNREGWDDVFVTVLGDRQCSNACCDLHRCERGPNAVYCMDHWRSWETAA